LPHGEWEIIIELAFGNVFGGAGNGIGAARIKIFKLFGKLIKLRAVCAP